MYNKINFLYIKYTIYIYIVKKTFSQIIHGPLNMDARPPPPIKTTLLL